VTLEDVIANRDGAWNRAHRMANRLGTLFLVEETTGWTAAVRDAANTRWLITWSGFPSERDALIQGEAMLGSLLPKAK
jgi:hypothetical protein